MKKLLTILPALCFMFWLAASWLTHIVVCFKAGSWGFLIAGAIFFPVAIGHGTWSWFQ